DEGGPPTHTGVRDEEVESGKECAHHYIGRELHSRRREHIHQRQLAEYADRRALQGAARHADENDENDRADDDQGHVLAHPAGEAARLLYAPEKIEAVLDLLDRADQRPCEERESHRADYSSADAVG